MRATLLAALLLCACRAAPNRVGILTEENIAYIAPKGDLAAARPGDYYLRNRHAVFIVQRPGRELALGPYGGTVIDAALRGGADHFGELIPTLAVGRTLYVTHIRIIADGSDGGPVEIEAIGHDATNVYYNLEAVAPALLAYAPNGGGTLGHDPDAPLGLEIRVRYSLPLDEARLSIEYSFENVSDSRVGVPFAMLVDSRGELESFVPGSGFVSPLTKSFDPSQLSAIFDTPPSPFMLLSGDAWALSLVPRRVEDRAPPRVFALTVPSLGGVLAIGAGSAPGAFRDASFALHPGERAEVELDLLLGDVPDVVAARAWEQSNVALGAVSGCVTSGAEPAAGVRVGLTHAERGTVAFFRTDGRGCFAGLAPVGPTTAIAGRLYYPPSQEVPFAVPGEVLLEVPRAAELAVDVAIYDSLDSPLSTRLPCRLTLEGTRQIVSHPALGDAPVDDAGGSTYRIFSLPTCHDTVEVAPGVYRAFVTRGPEYDRLDLSVEAQPGASAQLTGELHRVVDSEGYAASDFHVHALFSPDSTVTPLARVLSMAAEGMDFWASTDHDFVVDYTRYILQLGLEGQLLTIPGSEVTTFDAGHFGAYPLDVQPMANGGAPDWAPDQSGMRPTFGELFSAIHARGALVQVNHPRGGDISIGAYFTRSGLTFETAVRHSRADPELQPVPSELLRYPPGLVFYSEDFDIIEVMNGASTYVHNGMVYEAGVEHVGHDWMSFLSSGMRAIAVANSDTHSLGALPGEPRTMVGGHGGGAAGIIAALRRGDAVLTTGPMLRAELIDASGRVVGLGETLTPSDSLVTLRVRVETPLWYDVDVLEVIANVYFADPSAGGVAPPLVRLPVQTSPVPRPNGGMARVAQIDIPLDVSAAPFGRGDGWLAVRAGGTRSSVYPAMLRSAHPYAMTNPIFLDLDGDGRWR